MAAAKFEIVPVKVGALNVKFLVIESLLIVNSVDDVSTTPDEFQPGEAMIR